MNRLKHFICYYNWSGFKPHVCSQVVPGLSLTYTMSSPCSPSSLVASEAEKGEDFSGCDTKIKEMVRLQAVSTLFILVLFLFFFFLNCWLAFIHPLHFTYIFILGWSLYVWLYVYKLNFQNLNKRYNILYECSDKGQAVYCPWMTFAQFFPLSFSCSSHARV